MIKQIAKILYSILSLGAVAAFVYILTAYILPDAGLTLVEADVWLVLFAYTITLLLSMPTAIKFMIFAARFTEHWLFAIGAFLVWSFIAPIGLFVASIVGIISAIVGIVRANRERAEKDDDTSLASDLIYRASRDRAARRLLDDNFDEDITIDDGRTVTVFRQIALIDFMDGKYALLSSLVKEDNVAEAYRIFIAEDGLYDLELVTDRLAYTIIYDRYRRLLGN